MPVRTAYREFFSPADAGGSAKVCDMAQVHKIAVVDTDKIFRQPRFDVCQFPVESFSSLSRHGRYLFTVAFEIVDLLQRKLDEQELAAVRNQNLGFVFQDFMLLDGLTVFENICLPQVIADGPVSQMEARAERFCEAFGIGRVREKYPAEISGGEKQRTAVARALMNSPYILLADEPTGNLDSRSCRAVIDAFLQAKNEMGATIFMVTHDSFAASFCDRVIVLRDGAIFTELTRKGTRREFMDELLEVLRELGGEDDDEE